VQEEDEERRRYCREKFADLPPELRQSIQGYLREKTTARRGDKGFEIQTEEVCFEFHVRNLPQEPTDRPQRTHEDYGPRLPRSHDPIPPKGSEN